MPVRKNRTGYSFYYVKFSSFKQAIFRIPTIALVLLVSSASIEKSFSALKLIIYLRSTMSNKRVSNLAILSVKSKKAHSVSLFVFVDKFDAKHDNRKLALH